MRFGFVVVLTVWAGLVLAGDVVGSANHLETGKSPEATDYRAEMIEFVKKIAAHARAVSPGFGVFPQNAAELGTDEAYIATVSGIGQEDTYYGYNRDGKPTPAAITNQIETNLDRFAAAGKLVLTVDYPFKNKNKPKFDSTAKRAIDLIYERASARGYVPYTTVRNLNYLVINPGHAPKPNAAPITTWSQVHEFMYQLQHAKGQNRQKFLSDLAASGFDLIVMDYSYDGSDSGKFRPEEIAALKSTLNGKVISYMSIGEAETYRWYWQKQWDADHDGRPDPGAPSWLDKENPHWKGNYKVRYWEAGWQDIIFDYLDTIIAQGFDGVYLDIVDAYEYYQGK